MRLIDADAFLQNLINCDIGRKILEKVIEAVKKQPTAYDLDKIVDQLNDKFRVVRTDEDLEWNRAMDEAITIVKGGGVNAKTDS